MTKPRRKWLQPLDVHDHPWLFWITTWSIYIGLIVLLIVVSGGRLRLP
jgi:hypothetical protein